MPGRNEETTPEDVLEAFDDRDDRAEPLTAPEVAEKLNCSRRTALNKLNALEADDVIASKRVGGRSKVFWTPLEAEPEPTVVRETPVTPTDDRRDRSPADEPPVDDGGVSAPTIGEVIEADLDIDPDAVDDRVWSAVDRVADGWDDDHRLETRKTAAALVLQHAVESGEYVGQSDPVVESVRERYPVDGQNETTWWKKNIRAVLSEVGDYSRGKHGYRVDRDALESELADGV